MVLLLNRVVRPAEAGDQRDRTPMRPRAILKRSIRLEANLVPER